MSKKQGRKQERERRQEAAQKAQQAPARVRVQMDAWALGLVAVLAVPMYLLFNLPPENNPLGQASTTPAIDFCQLVLRVVMVALLVFHIGKTTEERPLAHLNFGVMAVLALACYICYIVTLGFYYTGNIDPTVILGMTLLPAAALALFGIAQRNWPALAATLLYAFFHLASALANFL